MFLAPSSFRAGRSLPTILLLRVSLSSLGGKHRQRARQVGEAAEALENLKHHLQSPPILTTPLPGEELLLYIVVTTHVVSTAIVVERPEEGHTYGVQRPVYFISEVLSESKVR